MNVTQMNAPRTIDSAFTEAHETQQYRSISKAAVVCVVFALMSVLAFMFEALVLLPLLSICFGLFALSQIKKYPEELTGKTATQIGVAVSSIVLVSAVVMYAYIYATEVPDGYQRISFYTLEPNKRTKLPVSEAALEFDGEKVFLKGYVRPGMKKNRLKKFIMVGDFGSCCFGGNPKITDVVAVRLINDDDYVNYGYRLRRIGGEFTLHRRPKSVREKDLPSIIYEIEADYVK